MTSKHWPETSFRHWARENARITSNAKLAALVTPELAELLERLTNFAASASEWYDEYHAINDIGRARTLAARIREALAQEVNGD